MASPERRFTRLRWIASKPPSSTPRRPKWWKHRRIYRRGRINETIVAMGEKYRIAEIAVDRWNATQISQQLSGVAFEIMAFGQGVASMNSPTKKLEELVLAKKLAHGGNPVLRWMAGNVCIEKDAADNWKPSKKRSPERIDGIVALIMATGRAALHDLPTWSV